MAHYINPSWSLAKQAARLRMDKTPDWTGMDTRISPSIWKKFNGDSSDLDRMILVCPDPHFFLSLLMHSYLLDPAKAPSCVRTWLSTQKAVLRLGYDLSLEALEQTTWRKIPVPVAVTDKGCVHWILVGTGPGLPLFPRGANMFDARARHAVATISNLVARTKGDTVAVCPVHPHAAKDTVSGPSLGLPVFLGAIAAHDNLDCSAILATGTVTIDGRITKVGHLREKMQAAPAKVQIFIHPRELFPEECFGPGTSLECVPVGNIHQALAVLQCQTPGIGQKVAAAQEVLNAGTGMARELCGLCSGMESWVEHNREKIRVLLKKDPDLKSLVDQIKKWNDSTIGEDHTLGDAVLECLDLEAVRCLAKKRHRPAWDIALLQMDKANHAGRIDQFPDWQTIADNLKSEIIRQRDGEQEHLLYYIRTAINNSHNRFDFDPELPGRLQESMALHEEIQDLEKTFEHRYKRRGPCEDSMLGRYYGTLGQHFFFCGSDYHAQGIKYIDKAMHAFGEGQLHDECKKEWERDLCYKAFGLIEAKGFDTAQKELARVCGRIKEKPWPITHMNPFQIHCLLRLYVDSKGAIHPEVWSAVKGRVQTINGHPGQLLALNLALLAENKNTKKEWYKISLNRCLHSGPTIKAMALLPLAHMHHEGMDSPTMERDCMQIQNIIESTGLYREHFMPILKSKSWSEILIKVFTMQRKLFPYMYR